MGPLPGRHRDARLTMETNIHIATRSAFLQAESRPIDGHYVFVYTIRISNAGPEPVRLLKRHWIITDANGQVQEVRGEGVVGEQPRLAPGRAFEYTSGAVLATPVGSMRGSYQFVTDAGELFDAPISAFTLAVPGAIN